MIKQFLQRWLGVQELSDSVSLLKHHEETKQLDGLSALLDDNTESSSYAGLTRINLDGYPTSYQPQPGDTIEPEPIKPKVIKGYARPQ